VILPAGLERREQGEEAPLVRAHLVVIEGKRPERPAALAGQETHEPRQRPEGADAGLGPREQAAELPPQPLAALGGLGERPERPEQGSLRMHELGHVKAGRVGKRPGNGHGSSRCRR
jgi:hypothetical protein